MNSHQLYIQNSNRLQTEKEFHNKVADSIFLNDLSVFENFEAATVPENKFILKKIGNVSGKTLLDIGCGTGEASVYFAIRGAKVTAVDVSEKMLKIAKRLALRHNASIRILQLPVENISSLNVSFDYIYGNGILHHADLGKAAFELSKVLSNDGKAVFIEPLSYNPVIGIYRKLANGVRTPDERPLNFNDIESFKRYFRKVEHKEFWLFSLLIFIFLFLKGLHPSKVRYWKYIIRYATKYKRLYSILSLFDRIVLKAFPCVRKFCWNTVIILEGPLNA